AGQLRLELAHQEGQRFGHWPPKGIHHRDTEDTEKTRTKSERTIRASDPLSLLSLSLFFFALVFSVSSVSLWLVPCLQVYRALRCCGSKNTGSSRSTCSSPLRVSSTPSPVSVSSPCSARLSKASAKSFRISDPNLRWK